MSHAISTRNHKRMAAGQRQASIGFQVESDRRGGESSSAQACASQAGQATGLLIAQLHATIPTVYTSVRESLEGLVAQLVQRGHLHEDRKGENAGELVRIGIYEMMHPALEQYEYQWGELVHIHVDPEGFNLSVYQDCHSWRMRLKPILQSLTAERGRQFVQALNKSCVQGEAAWDHIAGYGRVDDDDSTVAAWLEALYDSTPALGAGNQTLMNVFCGEKPSDPELETLIDTFVAADTEARCYQGHDALMCTTWDLSCPMEHGHDYVKDGIHNQGWDNNDHAAFECYCKNLDELERAFELIGNCIAAATALEEWSNKKCQT